MAKTIAGKKEVQFSLVYRDMWQSSGKYVPRRDQLAKIAPVIIDMGCFDRVETNGGASEQVNLLYGENPNLAVRTFTKPFNEVGIKTHMLDRGLNALRMNPVPADVRRLMYKVKHAQGTDITRIFCGLNDPRNIIPSIKWAKEAGMTAQATMCITYSKVHTTEYYINLAEQLIEAGAQEICLKDMAGIGRPAMLGNIVAAIKEKHPDIIIQYHGHTGPGFSVASMLEVAKAGGDVLDVAYHHSGDAEGCRFPCKGHQHESLYGGTQSHAELHRRFPRLLDRPEERADDLTARWLRFAGRNDGQSDG